MWTSATTSHSSNNNNNNNVGPPHWNWRASPHVFPSHRYFTPHPDSANLSSSPSSSPSPILIRPDALPRRNSEPAPPLCVEQRTAFNPLSPAFNCEKPPTTEKSDLPDQPPPLVMHKQTGSPNSASWDHYKHSSLNAVPTSIMSSGEYHFTRSTENNRAQFWSPPRPQTNDGAEYDVNVSGISQQQRWQIQSLSSNTPYQRARSVSLSPAFSSPLSSSSPAIPYTHTSSTSSNQIASPLLQTATLSSGLHAQTSPKSHHTSSGGSPNHTAITPLTPPFTSFQLRPPGSPPLSLTTGNGSPSTATGSHSRHPSGLSSSIPNLILSEEIDIPPPSSPAEQPLSENDSQTETTKSSLLVNPTPNPERSTTSWLPKTSSIYPLGASVPSSLHSMLGQYRNPPPMAPSQQHETTMSQIVNKPEFTLEPLPPTLPAKAPLPPGSIQIAPPTIPFPPPLPHTSSPTSPSFLPTTDPPESLMLKLITHDPSSLLNHSNFTPSSSDPSVNSYDNRSPMEQFLLESNNKPSKVDNKIAEVSSILESNLTLAVGCDFTPFPVPSDPPSASSSPLLPPKLPLFFSHGASDFQDANTQRTRSQSLCSESLFLHPYQFPSTKNSPLEAVLQQGIPPPNSIPPAFLAQPQLQHTAHRLTQRTTSVPSRLNDASKIEKSRFTPGYPQNVPPSAYSDISGYGNVDPLGYMCGSPPNYVLDYRQNPHNTSPEIDTLMARQRFAIHIDDEGHTNDSRTTLMIRNIPNKYSQKMLLEEIDALHSGAYDFFYLPIDFKNKCNVGYAFINMISIERIPSFYYDFNNKRWSRFNSEKICEITYARIQGLVQLVDHFKSSSLLAEEEKVRPVMLLNNELQPFPVGVSLRVLRGHRDVIVTCNMPYLV
ncbi:RNA recognition motif 2 [Pelomyxa schiedti]|nr:RNA recognition motif 2 [Pelomyxa schiedti]